MQTEEFVSKITHTIERKRILRLTDCKLMDGHGFPGILQLSYEFIEAGETINLMLTYEEVEWLYDQFGKALGVS